MFEESENVRLIRLLRVPCVQESEDVGLIRLVMTFKNFTMLRAHHMDLKEFNRDLPG